MTVHYGQVQNTMKPNNFDLFSLEGKRALVTGASRGLGRAMAVALAQAGATVVCSSSREGGTDETIAEIESFGGYAIAAAADLSAQDSIDDLLSGNKAEISCIDILINNAGTIARHPAVEFPMAEWERVMQVNLNASFYLSQQVGKCMIERGLGKIINIASMLSYSGGLNVAAYTASKHAVAGMTKALANEWAQHNIQVNAIAPGYFRTDNTRVLQDDSGRSSAITQRIPTGRWGSPADLAGAAVFLASSASDYVNGHVLAVDGGWLAS